MYARSDITQLARSSAYSRLQYEDVTVGQALALAASQPQPWPPTGPSSSPVGSPTCSRPLSTLSFAVLCCAPQRVLQPSLILQAHVQISAWHSRRFGGHLSERRRMRTGPPPVSTLVPPTISASSSAGMLEASSSTPAGSCTTNKRPGSPGFIVALSAPFVERCPWPWGHLMCRRGHKRGFSPGGRSACTCAPRVNRCGERQTLHSCFFWVIYLEAILMLPVVFFL